MTCGVAGLDWDSSVELQHHTINAVMFSTDKCNQSCSETVSVARGGAAWNLNRRTNTALVQTSNVNSLNQLTTGAHSGTMTVAEVKRKASTGGGKNIPRNPNVKVDPRTGDVFPKTPDGSIGNIFDFL
jgi:hypothetical protein